MTDVTGADQALKARHRAMWALGDYPAVAVDVIPALGPVLVQACGIKAGDDVLDVAAGTGNAAIPAARAGANVTAGDLTPELLEIGRKAAEAEGLTLDWREADAERLPFGPAEFDVVMSCVGVMFAPHHRPAAAELLRVCRPGGTIGVLSWTPDGFIGQMFATMKPFLPPPPPGAQPPPLWGDSEHVRELFGEDVSTFHTVLTSLPVTAFGTPDALVDYFKANYGPTIVAYRGIAAEPDRVAELDAALVQLARKFGAGSGPMDWEYLLVTATRA